MRARRHGRARGMMAGAIIALALSAVAAGIAVYFLVFHNAEAKKDIFYEEAFSSYIELLDAQSYKDMYAMLSEESKALVSEEEFLSRHENIYGGIEASNIEIEVLSLAEREETPEDVLGVRQVGYRVTMETMAGPVSFTHDTEVQAVKRDKEIAFQLTWGPDMIFPAMEEGDRVSVSKKNGARGAIYDRNGIMLAGPGLVKDVGFVPGKMAEDPAEDIQKVAEILGISVEKVNRELSQKWVREDHFVHLKYLSEQDVERKLQLLEIPGIRINDKTERVYALGNSAAHLTGYIRQITAEQLAERPGQDYHANSSLGILGLESLFEERIRAIDGCNIVIKDANGNIKETIADRAARDGENIYLTIDSVLQQNLYEEMKEEKGTAVVMNPYSGEVLAIVSTPAYDPNEFVLGVPDFLWQEWNEDPRRPLYNRFKATFCPGSSMKPIIAAIGLQTEAITADEILGYHGRSWQKDQSWGAYKITTLKEYGNDVSLRNGILYSDNIYFAKVALRVGAERLAEELREIGFGETIPFEFGMTISSFGTDYSFSSEIELADSGYGQGRVLINPLHMASIYSAFLNAGDMVKPHLLKGGEGGIWKAGVFSADAAQTVRECLLSTVTDAKGNAHELYTSGLTMGGKTGTAEIKASKEDTTGTELGWFAGFSEEKQLLFVGMIEDVKERGGSHYVLPLAKHVLTGQAEIKREPPLEEQAAEAPAA